MVGGGVGAAPDMCPENKGSCLQSVVDSMAGCALAVLNAHCSSRCVCARAALTLLCHVPCQPPKCPTLLPVPQAWVPCRQLQCQLLRLLLH